MHLLSLGNCCGIPQASHSRSSLSTSSGLHESWLDLLAQHVVISFYVIIIFNWLVNNSAFAVMPKQTMESLQTTYFNFPKAILQDWNFAGSNLPIVIYFIGKFSSLLKVPSVVFLILHWVIWSLVAKWCFFTTSLNILFTWTSNMWIHVTICAPVVSHGLKNHW